MRTHDRQKALDFVEITYGTDLHEQEISLRSASLREPLGLKFTKKELESERNELRYGLVDRRGKLVACLLARDLGGSLVKLRQMAVAEEQRGKGTGSELIRKAEKDLQFRGYEKIELNARGYAVGFYEKMNYREVGEEFIEIGIPHIKMIKAI